MAEPGAAELPGTAWASAPRPRGGGKGGRRGGARHRGPAPCSALEAGYAVAARPGRSPPGAARAPGASSGPRRGGQPSGEGRQVPAAAPGRSGQERLFPLVLPLRPPAPVPLSGRPSRPASAAGCHRHRRSLPGRSYTGPRLGEPAAGSQPEMPFPVCSVPPPSQSREPRAASGSGPVSGAAQRPGSPREPGHDKFHRALGTFFS